MYTYSYEPELHPGATYKWKDVKATFKIFQTGAITVTAPNVASIDLAVQHIYPLVVPFRKEKPNDPHLAHMRRAAREQLEKEKENENNEQSNGKRRKGPSVGGERKRKRRRSVDDSDVEDGDAFIDDKTSDADGDSEDGGATSEEEAKFTDEDE